MTGATAERRRSLCGAALGLGLVMLGACARLPRSADGPAPGAQTPPRWSGRLALQVEGSPERSFAADFELSGSAEQGELLLSGPLGTAAAQARWAPGQARLRTAQGEQQHPDLEGLAHAVLGEPLPMAALFDWLRGRPWPGAAAEALADAAPGFTQLGWQVDLARWGEGRLDARRLGSPTVHMRVRLLPP